MQKRNAGQAVGAEVTAEAKVDSGQNAVPDVTVHILASRQNNFVMAGKQPDERFGGKLHDRDGGNSPENCYGQGIAQYQSRAVMLSGSDILGAKRRYGGKHGGGNQE